MSSLVVRGNSIVPSSTCRFIDHCLQLSLTTVSSPRIYSYGDIHYLFKRDTYIYLSTWSYLRESILCIHEEPLRTNWIESFRREGQAIFSLSLTLLRYCISAGDTDEGILSFLLHILSISLLNRRLLQSFHHLIASVDDIWHLILKKLTRDFKAISLSLSFAYNGDAILSLMGNIIDGYQPSVSSPVGNMQFVQLLSTFIDVVDASVFDYESPHRWKVEGKNHISVLVEPAVRDQLYGFTNEAFLRNLFASLLSCDATRLKPRRRVHEPSSLAGVASRSSSVLWKTSQWAINYMKDLVRGKGGGGDSTKVAGGLVNTSEMSRTIAGKVSETENPKVTKILYNIFCTFW
jgi:hypothetical protein